MADPIQSTVTSVDNTVKADVKIAASDLSKIETYIKTEVAKLKADEQTLVADLKAGSFTLKSSVLYALLGAAAVLGAIVGHIL